jgi:L-asparagine transporter-like permease
MDQNTTPSIPASPLMPTPKQQSWGALISIVVIVGMIIIGAFYAWGERIAEERALTVPVQTQP